MEIVIRVSRKRREIITRNRNGDGAIRVGGEGCDAILEVMDRLQYDYCISVKDVATAMLVAAARNMTEVRIEEAEACQG